MNPSYGHSSLAELLATQVARLKSKEMGPFEEFYLHSKDKRNADANCHYFGGALDRTAVLGRVVQGVLSEKERVHIRSFTIMEVLHGRVNAFAKKTRTGKSLVVLNHGLLRFAYAAFNLWLLHLEDEEKVNRILRKAVLRCFVANEDMHGGEPEIVVPHVIGGAGGSFMKHVSVLCMELFIVCHEIGHHVCGHFDGKTNRGEDTASTNRVKREQELEADRKALDLYFRVLEGNGPMVDWFLVRWVRETAPQGTLGFDMFFSFLDLAMHLLQREPASPDRSTHPAPLERREKLKNLFCEQYEFDSNQWDVANGIADFCAKHKAISAIH